MKTLSTIFAVALASAFAAKAQSVLLAGFDGNQTENNAISPKTLTGPLQHSSAVGNVSVSLSTSSTLVSTGFDWAGGFQSASAIWGISSDLDPDASTANNNAVYAHDALATIEMTITNTGTFDVTLDKLLMRVKRDNTNAATGIRVTYVSGDLSDTSGINALFALNAAASTVGYDFALPNLISDFTLAAGESATFTWASEGGTGGRTRFDNIALTGTVSAPADITAPTPSPMTWASVPTATGESSITMTATTATDDSGVEYEFTRYAADGTTLLFTSTWQDSPVFTDTGLVPSTEYKYTVRARDKSANNNPTDPSTPLASATTDPADATPPSPSPMNFLVSPLPVSSSAITMTATTATDANGVEYQFTRYAADGTTLLFTSPWQASPTYIDTGRAPATTYTYTVKARDKSIAKNETAASTPVAAAATLPAAGIGTTLVGGFHGGNETALQSGTITNVNVTLTSSTGDITQGFSQITSTLWGATDLDVDAPTGQTPAELAIIQATTITPFTLTLTVTNNDTVDLPLDALHFIVKKDTDNQGPQDFTIAYTAGDLGSPASTIIGLPNVITGFDVPLASFLGDTTLAAGETATFTWTSGAPQDPAGNTAIRIDNFAISSPVAGPGGTTYAIWSGGAAANDDTNGDGVQNAVAYVLGAADVNEVVTGDVPTQDNTTNPDFYIFNFRRSADAAADATTTIAAQYGNDLAGWTTAVDDATNVIITETGDFYETAIDKVEVKLRRSALAPGGKLFARLLVTVTP
jgi:hypothetical protein